MKKTYKGIIDRFEGAFAVVLIGEEQDVRIDIPKEMIEKDAKEGYLVTISVKMNINKTLEAQKSVSNMIEALRSRK